MDTMLIAAGSMGALLAGYFIYKQYRKAKPRSHADKMGVGSVASVLAKDSGIAKAMSSNPVLAKTAGFSYM
jgi:hypothetical protein